MKFRLIPWLSASLFVLFQFTYQLSLGSLIQALIKDFQINATRAGILIGSFYYLYAILQIPAGFLFDRYSAKYILSLGALLASLGSFSFAISHDFIFALLSRMTFGTGAAVSFVGLLYVIRTHFPFRIYAMMIGLSETVGLITSLLTTVAFAYLIQTHGWRFCFWLGGGLGLIIAILNFFSIPLNHQVKPFDWQNFKGQLKHVLRNKKVWLNGVYISINFGVVTVFAALWATPFLMTKLSLTLPQASKLSAFCLLGAALGCPLYGFLGQLVARRELLLFFSCALTGCLLLICIFGYHLSYNTYELIMFLIGLSCTNYMVAFTISDELASPEIKNTLAGFTNMLAVSSAPLLQPVIGWLLDTSKADRANYLLSDYQYGLAILPILAFINCIVVFQLPQKKVIANIQKQPPFK